MEQHEISKILYTYIYILDEIKQFPTQNWLTRKTWCHTATKDMVDITATKTCFPTKSKYVMFIYIYIYTTGRPKRDSLKRPQMCDTHFITMGWLVPSVILQSKYITVLVDI